MSDISGRIVIAGGYGVVGRQIARLIASEHSQHGLSLGGRYPKTVTLDAAIAAAELIEIDTAHAKPLSGHQGAPLAVINVVNDPQDNLLLECANRGIPYLDITRWTARVEQAQAKLGALNLAAPVILSSGWMGGIAALMTAQLASGLQTLDSVEIDVLYYQADKAGPNSVEYMDRFAKRFSIRENHGKRSIAPLSRGKYTRFYSGSQRRVYTFDTPERLTLATNLGAATVIPRIGFDSAAATQALVWMRRLGILRLLSARIFTGARRALLYAPGPGAAHEIVVTVTGRDAAGVASRHRLSLNDPLGQTHLTACGAAIQLALLLDTSTRALENRFLSYPELHPNPAAALAWLADQGVSIRVELGE